MLLIPVHQLRGRSGGRGARRKALVVAHAKVDDGRADLALLFWTLHSGYAARREGTRTIFMHHEVAGRRPGFDVSHKDTDKLNNQKDNLVHETRSQNMLNPLDTVNRARTSCPYRGVTRDDQSRELAKPWRGKVRVDGRTYQTRRFATPEEAHQALQLLRASLGLRVRDVAVRRPT